MISLISMGLAVGACMACLRMSRRLSRLCRRTQELISQAERALRFSALTLKDTDSRVMTLERNARTLKDAQHHLESRSNGGPGNYGQAITLVKRGWRIEDLITNCGLTRGVSTAWPGWGVKWKGRRSKY